MRWVFLLSAVVGAARCAVAGTTPARLAFAAVCALLWFGLSRRKIHSIDRDVVGLPPRR